MTAAKITEADLRRHSRNGLTAQEVADKHGITRNQVYRRVRALGITLRRVDETPADDKVEMMLRLGATKREAADKLGVSESWLHRKLNDLGWRDDDMPKWTSQQRRDYHTLLVHGFKAHEARAMVERPKVKIRATPPEARA